MEGRTRMPNKIKKYFPSTNKEIYENNGCSDLESKSSEPYINNDDDSHHLQQEKQVPTVRLVKRHKHV